MKVVSIIQFVLIFTGMFLTCISILASAKGTHASAMDWGIALSTELIASITICKMTAMLRRLRQ